MDALVVEEVNVGAGMDVVVDEEVNVGAGIDVVVLVVRDVVT